MKLIEAINIVMDLARQNVLDESEAISPELVDEATRQQQAVNMVSDYIYNYLEDKLADEEEE